MIVLGLNGGISMPYENVPMFGTGENHDSAAALIIDGELVGAIEEERLNRIKHTNKFPINAIKAVLHEQNLTLENVDFFAYYVSEESITSLFKKFYYADATSMNLLSPRACLAELFDKAFGFKLDEDKIVFVDHHIAHAASCFYLSGFDKALIVTLDGVGENISGRILYGNGVEMRGIDLISEINSLGQYYVAVSKFIGYDLFDEYKVMGLAPYGDPAKYRDIFSCFYKLLPEGKFEINREYIRSLLFGIGTPRRKGQKFEQIYMDVAAALQESLEVLVMHVVGYYAKKSGYDKLCLSGGVAHNCSANGKILYSELFKEIFVQPAAHDAGNSIGAAICAYLEKSSAKKIKKLEHVYIGTPIEEGKELEKLLTEWSAMVDFTKEENIGKKAAKLIAEAKILGWVQGKSEFGPRALGNRSIIADPRPEENKNIVNMMVKKREAYRPFAPSVLEESASQFFDVKLNGTALDYMTFVVNVKEKYRDKLGAITHVDGTARIQTVNKTRNSKYWNLINEFGKITGIPMVLNTSFNNNVEPIVNSSHDAIVCFLTTGLDYLVIGDYLISKRSKTHVAALKDLIPSAYFHTIVCSKNSYDSLDSSSMKYEIGFNHSAKYNQPISCDVFDLLSKMDGRKTVSEILSIQATNDGQKTERLLTEIDNLWNLRYINLSPRQNTIA